MKPRLLWEVRTDGPKMEDTIGAVGFFVFKEHAHASWLKKMSSGPYAIWEYVVLPSGDASFRHVHNHVIVPKHGDHFDVIHPLLPLSESDIKALRKAVDAHPGEFMTTYMKE